MNLMNSHTFEFHIRFSFINSYVSHNFVLRCGAISCYMYITKYIYVLNTIYLSFKN